MSVSVESLGSTADVTQRLAFEVTLHSFLHWQSQSYLDSGLLFPLGPSGDEKSPSLTVTGDPAGPMPADTHLF